MGSVFSWLPDVRPPRNPGQVALGTPAPPSTSHPVPSPNTSPFQGLGCASLPPAPDSYRRQPFLVLCALFARTPTPAPSHLMAQSVLQAMSSLDPSRRFWLFYNKNLSSTIPRLHHILIFIHLNLCYNSSSSHHAQC